MMHILIFGASGGVGLALVKQALAQGNKVTAAVRSPMQFPIKHERLCVRQCNAFQPEQIEALFTEDVHYDAVASCLNTNQGVKLGHDLEQMMKNIVPVLQKHHLRRIVYCASAGVDNELTGERGLAAMEFLRYPLADHRAAIACIHAANLLATIVRPLGLTDDDLSGNYLEAAQGVPEQSCGRIARADVAHFMLKALHDDNYIGQSVAIAAK